MLRSKYFWIAMVILVPFIIVWITEGFGWAIATLVIMGILFLLILGGTRSARRRKRYYYYDDDDYGDDRDINININYSGDEERRPRKWHVPPVVPINPKYMEKEGQFYKGIRDREKRALDSMRKSQEDARRRTKKNLWG